MILEILDETDVRSTLQFNNPHILHFMVDILNSYRNRLEAELTDVDFIIDNLNDRIAKAQGEEISKREGGE